MTHEFIPKSRIESPEGPGLEAPAFDAEMPMAGCEVSST